MFLNDIAEWAFTKIDSDGGCWDDSLNLDVLLLYSAWSITAEALEAGSCKSVVCTVAIAILHTIFSDGIVEETCHTISDIDLLLPVDAKSPHPFKRAKLPRDLVDKLANHVFILEDFFSGNLNNLTCMDVGPTSYTLGTFFMDWTCGLASSPLTVPHQAVYYSCTIQTLRKILKLPNGVLQLATMTIVDECYVGTPFLCNDDRSDVTWVLPL
ncbi:hypothetical protein BDN71DRAFT_1431478 [Pleurotus eryngii]|uniref:Uncharacterized protein n=1 Tax=Pleurotus eryngii TaxID=5323 RepID=A0A9P5ZWN6_PLEER|nr:hypothetical protein BDN71DRAFT_1431478 [Pleurotus eryngii]